MDMLHRYLILGNKFIGQKVKNTDGIVRIVSRIEILGDGEAMVWCIGCIPIPLKEFAHSWQIVR